GINEKVLPYVFERFRQADTSITRRYSGLGLGLAIARRLVELHGGSISAESAGEHQGATFIVTLPLGPADQATAAETALGRELPLLADLSILVVDDEAETRNSVTTVLASCGSQTRGASSANEAVAIFSATRVDVVLVDIAMPDEDGYALLARLRAEDQARNRHTPVIALTGFADVDHRRRVVEAG